MVKKIQLAHIFRVTMVDSFVPREASPVWIADGGVKRRRGVMTCLPACRSHAGRLPAPQHLHDPSWFDTPYITPYTGRHPYMTTHLLGGHRHGIA